MHPSIYFDPFETLGRWNQLFNRFCKQCRGPGPVRLDSCGRF